MSETARPSTGLLVGAVAASILAVSTAATLFRLSEAGPMAKAFHRLFFASLLLLAWGLVARREAFRTIRRADALPIVAAGLLLAAHFATWVASLDFTTVAASLLLVTSHPLLVSLASHVRGERLAPTGWIGLLIALFGAGIIFLVDSGAQSGAGPPHPNPALGNALAFAGAVAIAGYLLLARRIRQRVDLVPYAAATYGVAAVGLFVAMLAFREPVVGYSTWDYGIFLALAVVPMIGGHTILNWAIRWVPAPVVSATVLGEPVAGTAIAFVVLREVPGAGVFVGGLLVLTGIALVAQGQRA